jgi:hypothetical protein
MKWLHVAQLVEWLDDNNRCNDTEMGMRILKISEEAGEAAAAWIGHVGQNPRKGFTHTEDDVAAELCDVAVTALVALASLLGPRSSEEYFASHLQALVTRVEKE